MNLEAMGWIATVLSVASYFFREPAVLRRVQAGASFIWIVYGLIIGSAPLVACNVIVAAAAMYSSLRMSRDMSRSNHVVSFALKGSQENGQKTSERVSAGVAEPF